MEKYNHQEIDAKWQQAWQEQEIDKTSSSQDRPKYYVLDMFPYPSGQGLHVGHPRGYIATDILARYQRLCGFNVLHPMGWDAFGLPAENYALKNKVHPSAAVKQNIATYKAQLAKLGLSYDWSREINTTDPAYYHWTQWAFLQMYKKGLVYQSNEPINWCPSCLTGLANEDLEDGKCERCGSVVEQKPLPQWVIRITDYAQQLLDGLEQLPDWEEPIKDMQRNWIGQSRGAQISFALQNSGHTLEVFTTRPDTLFGATYLVVCPEHPIIDQLGEKLTNYQQIIDYRTTAQNKTDLERTDLNKDKTGVKLDNISAINPVNQQVLPIFVADYVLAGYGTGAIMAVPAHDQRDFEFATKYHLPIVQVVKPTEQNQTTDGCYAGTGRSINSDFLNGQTTDQAKQTMIDWLVKEKLGEATINYRLKDWVFSRQRYWGEPIPLVHCAKCGVVPVDDKDLPLTLPEVDSYAPSGTGESPLAKIEEWVNTTCPRCSGPARRETNTMPQWAGSCWYYLRYINPQNSQALVDPELEKYWAPVDFYVGGAEHATRHLIYARFWHKFLYDIKAVSQPEPFAKLRHVGLILATDGRKMSKRWNNVINPDDIVAEFGADALRVYEMFMGPFDQPVAWNTDGLRGVRKFLDRVWALSERCLPDHQDSDEVLHLLHKTIKKVGADIVDFKFNTAVSSMMILANFLTEQSALSLASFKLFLLILSPFAPHVAEELWQQTKEQGSIFKRSWPSYDPKLAADSMIDLIIQVNGKLRQTLRVPVDIAEEEAKKLALENEKIIKCLVGQEVVKVIFIKGKLVSIVAK